MAGMADCRAPRQVWRMLIATGKGSEGEEESSSQVGEAAQSFLLVMEQER